ncbi:HK97-gp10 family putative phage morphogenesis protein [Glaciecola sp. 2405UD65-10]|uniref:HK97-gp10 family putative phage morphogenesis protein n=1 Tax=Glaciecola sp. 2405UD65-10 TaxID=3397244 RepID=UPI003B58C003
MPSTTYKTSGLKNLEQAIAELGKQSGFKVLTGAMRDAAKPIIKASRDNAPKGNTGKLKKGIRSQVFRGKGKSDSVATLHVGFHRQTSWYGQILERGAKKHTIKPRAKGGKKVLKINGSYRSSTNHPGTKSYPMLKQAFDAQHKNAIKILKQRLKERIILEAVKKYGKSAR